MSSKNLTNYLKMNKFSKIYEKFISNISLFDDDLHDFNSKIKSSIENLNVLVIGGAGTIGSNYIKEILKIDFFYLINI